MIQGNFQHVKGPETIGALGGHLGFVVESFHATEVNLSFRPEPFEQEFPVIAQHLGHLLHRRQPGTHGSCTPVVEELSRPDRQLVLPEPLEVLLEQVGPDRFEVAGEQILQLVHLVIGEVLWSFQQAPTAASQHRFFLLGFEGLGLLGPDVVDGLVHVLHHMEPVEDVDRRWCHLRDDPQVGSPHVAADKPQSLASLQSKPVEKTPESLGGPVTANPEQPSAPAVQLVDHGDKLLLLLAPADLISADGGHVVQVAMREAPLHMSGNTRIGNNRVG